jgi:5-methylthioadenosine/S-adenosylhomocysteine deaminase
MHDNLMEVDLLISGGMVATMDADETLYTDGAVAINDMEIAIVGSRQEVESQVQPHERLDASGKVIVPGLINAHTHAAMILFRGLADDMPLEPWLQQIWQYEAKFATHDNVLDGSRLAFAEMIRSGTTTAADMYWHSVAAAELAREVGFRFCFGPGLADFTQLGGILPDEWAAIIRDGMDRFRDDDLLEPCIIAHSTYAHPREKLEACARLVHEYNALFMIHASETKTEVADIQSRFGMTPIEYLDELGLLRKKTCLAHCVHLREDEIARLAETDTAVAHCPESNLKTGAGIAPIPEMLAAGVTVGLGTDGAATNNDLDLWGEMHTVALIHKGSHYDPTLMPAKQVFKMATSFGARALGMADKVGSLELGKRADIVLIDFDKVHLTPLYDVYSHLVYAANKADVCTVLINGQFVMKDRDLLTINEQDAKDQVRKIALEIQNSSNLQAD